jgi:LuxR family transcriptional regulator, maltose regulon positive regulatory protein
VVAALGRASPEVGEDVLPLLTPPNVASIQAGVIALINELEALPHELVLIFDDYHAIESASIHDSLSFFVSHIPPQLHLVIAGRGDPPLPIAWLRARDRLTELRAADLRFTADESRAFLQDIWGLDISHEVIRALESRTEGWAVGLQLAALSLQGRPDPVAFVDAFTGTHRFVLDYLSEEVLERQSDQKRIFLLRTSILERLSGPLCDAVTGEADSQDILEELERGNLFLIPLDEERRWYRLHHLFADLLRTRLQHSDPEAVPALHRRAATWFEEFGLVDDAIRHALEAGDARWAGELVEEQIGETLRRGENAILERRLSQLPDATVRSLPALCLAKAMMEFHLGHFDHVESFVSHAERTFGHGGEEGRFEIPTEGGMVAELPAATALLRALIAAARGDADTTTEFARTAEAHMSEEEVGPRFSARLRLIEAAWMRGRLAEAERAFADALSQGRAARAPFAATASCFDLGRVQEAEGKLSAALRTYQEGLRFASRSDRRSAYHAGEAHLGIAQVLYQRNELEEALHHVNEAVELEAIDLELDFALVVLARIRYALGDVQAALDAINEACTMHPGEDVVALWYPAPGERARLLLAQGRIDEAERWTEERGLSETDEVSYPRERDYLVLARVLLARAAPAEALALLDRLDALAVSQGRAGSVIEIRALRALALQASGDHSRALVTLGEALALGQPESYTRVFADEGAPMTAIVRSFIGATKRGRIEPLSGAARGHLNRIIRAFTPAVGTSEETPVIGGLVEPLTRRELEVLSLIAAGKRNREIADELVVTLETVKKHVSHIFDKLGAANRTEAVKQARELSIIS